MALVDTQGFVMAVDRSLFGPQGRRWIERKLPEVATNIAFIAVSAFGASVLVFHVCHDFSVRGYWAILQAPKYFINAIIVHLLARALRWHIDRMLGRSFMHEDEALPDFLGRQRRPDGDGGTDRVLWPWQSHPNKEKAITDSADSASDGHGGGGGGSRYHHRRSRSAESFDVVTASDGQGAADRNAAVAGPAGGSNEHNNNNKSGDGSRLMRAFSPEARKDGKGEGGRRGFPDIFASCRPHDHSLSPDSLPTRVTEPLSTDHTGGHRGLRSPFSKYGDGAVPAPSPTGSVRMVTGDSENDNHADVIGTLSSTPKASATMTWGDGEKGVDEERGEEAAGRRGSAEGRSFGSVSEDGGADGRGAGSRGSRRRLQALTLGATAGAEDEGWSGVRRRRRRVGDGKDGGGEMEGGRGEAGEEGNVTSLAGRGQEDGGADVHGRGKSASKPLKRRPSKSSTRWRSIDTISRALDMGSSQRRRAKRLAGGDHGSEQYQPNFFTESDLDELLHSTFFIKMCDDASWLSVEDRPFHPEVGWLLPLWGGYKVVPRFQGEVKQHEAHRMLFQCESGQRKDHVRIRSRATNTFLYFLGVKHPLTWVAWDRDVVGGAWEDLKLEWVGTPSGPDGVLMGDERGRVVLRSRTMNAYVSWNGSRFTHVSAREGAAVFMLQRTAPSPRPKGASSRKNVGGGMSSSRVSGDVSVHGKK